MNKKGKKIFAIVIGVLLTSAMCLSIVLINKFSNIGNVPDLNNSELSTNIEAENSESVITPSVPDNPTESKPISSSGEFIYKLVYSDLSQQYDTFTGYVSRKNKSDDNESEEIFGIGYADYEEGYVDETGKTYFSSGFISLEKQTPLKKANENSHFEVVSLEESYNELFSYVYSYDTQDMHKHCVYNNKYIQYDIIDDVIQYNEQEYLYGMDVDESRGNIYNYDTNEYVYIVTEEEYVPVNGVSVIGEANYEDIIEEVNNILKKQEANLTYEELKSYVVQSQDALQSYLLGLQEETFMGFPTAQLVEVVKNLDPMQHIRMQVNDEGITTVNIIEVTKLPTLWEKVATSFICAGAVVGGVFASIYGGPVGMTAGGMLIGTAIEIFSQVVISNTPTSDIQWAQVAVAAVAGAIGGGVSGAIGKIAAKGVTQVFFKEALDTLIDGLIGGGEYFVNSLIAGQTFEEACKNFGYGVIAGVVISGIFKTSSAALKGLSSKIVKKGTTDAVQEINEKTTKKLSSETSENGISELQEKAIKKSASESSAEAANRSANYYDDTGKLYRSGAELTPNNNYEINGYKYSTDEIGRIKNAEASPLRTKDWDGRKTIKDSIGDIGKGSEKIGDNRGHIIGDQFGGSNGLENMIPQDAYINKTTYKNFENMLAAEVKKGSNVEMYVNLIYEGTSRRPNNIIVNYVINGKLNVITFLN